MLGLTVFVITGVIIATAGGTQGKNICPQVEEDPAIDILLPHENDCSRFYKCSHGVAYEMDCPANLHFNKKSNICDWPANVKCTSTESSEDNQDSSEEENVCPPAGSGPEDDIRLPHKTDCSKFYKCSHGVQYVMDCPDGLHFNPRTKQCDWPDNVNCTNGGSEKEEEEHQCPSVEEDPEDYILFPHETDFTKFYKCSLGKKFEMDCYPGLHFNPETNQCNWPDNANCKSGNNGTNSGNEDGKEEYQCPSVEEDPDEDILFPHETDCTKFYKCSLGKKFEMDCYHGLHFNPKTNQCDWPENVNCTNGESEKEEENTCPSVEEDPEEDILFPHETDCSKFYKCNLGNKVEMDCYPGLHFNPKTNQCDWPENVGCTSGNSGANNGNENGKEEENKCPAVEEDPEEDILFPHETDCSKFYKCNLGNKVEMDCYPGLHFNPKTNQCDWPENVNCTSKPVIKRKRAKIEA